MIGPQQLIIATVCGAALIILGLVPDLFKGLTQGIINFSESIRGSGPGPSTHVDVDPPKWLSSTGFALILLAVLAYIG